MHLLHLRIIIIAVIIEQTVYTFLHNMCSYTLKYENLRIVGHRILVHIYYFRNAKEYNDHLVRLLCLQIELGRGGFGGPASNSSELPTGKLWFVELSMLSLEAE